MIASYSINKIFSVHESGTKYYQLMQISNSLNGRSVVIKHYGAYSDNNGADYMPKYHGQVLILKPEDYRGSSSNQVFNNTRNMKTKRGYAQWSGVDSSLTPQAFLKFIGDNFKTNDVREILSYVSVGEEIEDVLEDDAEPFEENKIDINTMSEAWASW